MSKSRNRKYSDDERQRPTYDTRAVSGSRIQRYKTSSSACNSVKPSSRNSRTKAALRCFECEGIRHFARECYARMRREANLSDSPWIRCQTDCSRPLKFLLQQAHIHNQARTQKNGTRETQTRCGAGSYLQLKTTEKAVMLTESSVLLEHDTPYISVDVDGVARRLILDPLSNDSLMQPCISGIAVKVTHILTYGITGEVLSIKGQQTFSSVVDERECSHTFLV